MKRALLVAALAIAIGCAACTDRSTSGRPTTSTAPAKAMSSNVATAPARSLPTPPTPAGPTPGVTSVVFTSAALGRAIGFDIYLPPGYDTGKRYPVLYLLYGYGGGQHSWFEGLNADGVATELITQRAIAPLIIVSPDYGNSFAVNTVPGQAPDPGGVSEGPYDDYLSRDLVRYVDSHYATIASREGRYVGGASMGGFAALHLAFRHPDLYSKVGGHSAALWTYTSGDQFVGQRDWLYPTEQLRDERDPFRLAGNPGVKQLDVYLDDGRDDMLLGKDEALYQALKRRGVHVQWHPNPGDHSMTYWQSHVRDYLLFYAGLS